jgi:hypothetical protein
MSHLNPTAVKSGDREGQVMSHALPIHAVVLHGFIWGSVQFVELAADDDVTSC